MGRTLHDSVPVPKRSPVRRLQPPRVWCATSCSSVQYLQHDMVIEEACRKDTSGVQHHKSDHEIRRMLLEPRLVQQTWRGARGRGCYGTHQHLMGHLPAPHAARRLRQVGKCRAATAPKIFHCERQTRHTSLQRGSRADAHVP